jgi:hypothetical protein
MWSSFQAVGRRFEPALFIRQDVQHPRSGCVSSGLRMSSISRNQLDGVLTALAELLESAGELHHLVVIGGSGLVAIGVISRPTRDVDVVALEADGALISAHPLPPSLLAAAATVARDLGLDRDWLNAKPASLLDHELPPGFRERLVSREYGPALRVSFASRADQICFKLDALIDRAEPRDLADLRQLAPSPSELRDAARWARTHLAPGPYDEALAHALETFGVEDEGRST